MYIPLIFNYKVIAFWVRFTLAIIAAHQPSLIILEILLEFNVIKGLINSQILDIRYSSYASLDSYGDLVE